MRQISIDMRKVCILFLLVIASIGTVSAANIRIEPHEQYVEPGETFTADVYVDPEGATVSGAQFNLNFDPAVLRANSVTEGDLLRRGGATYWNPGTINNGAGTITNVGDAALYPGGATTPGILATISFTAIGPRNTGSDLNLNNALMSGPDGGTLPCDAGQDGQCGIDGYAGINDIPISNLVIVGFIGAAGLIFVVFGRRRNK